MCTYKTIQPRVTSVHTLHMSILKKLRIATTTENTG